MRCLDSRRLTGPNLLWDKAGAVLDVQFESGDVDAAIEAWQAQVRRMLHALDWDAEQTCVRRFKDGASLAISAPLDALYAATDVNDWAFDAACDVLAGNAEPAVEEDAQRLRQTAADESNAKLLALKNAAAAHDTPMLIDTDEATLGYGRYSQTWPLDHLPDPDRLPWHEFGAIPLALVTGTNGKTTSVRLAASIAQAAGFTVGLSSTDWIAAGDVILDAGDYSGPGGARAVLRDHRVDIAILETARGGLLRRGLAVARADVVLITNVASDHLGEFGVNNVDELADVKWVATRALDSNGALVLNADDSRLVARARSNSFNITWFSPNPNQAMLSEHVRDGGTLCSVLDNQVALIRNRETRKLLSVADIPITLGGAATHNIYNVLGVVALAAGLGLPASAIVDGLRGLQPNDNPGRCNIFRINGAKIVVDFAHNPHGMAAFVGMVRSMPARRRILLIGQAGDRSDDDIRALVTAACAVAWDHVVIKQMDHYARGRAGGEVADILHAEFTLRGITENQVSRKKCELDAVKSLVDNARAGDLVALLIHESRADVLEFLHTVSKPD